MRKGSLVRILLVLTAILSFAIFVSYCSGSKNQVEATNTYLNLNDSAKFVGMSACMQCHPGIHQTFIETGMGQSFAKATPQKSIANFSGDFSVQDAILNYTYKAFWQGDSLTIEESRSGNPHNRKQSVSYIIGSGQHTNSHLYLSNGYLFQAPLTYYSQEAKWDLPPGFENGANERFDRMIGLECMTCHNAYPDFVKGSINKYNSIPQGIDCERCHGPGSIHVNEKQRGIIVDTSKYIDYSIVNPAKLPIDKQFDLCQRCHLQGNTILQKSKSFLDFKPGMKLSDVMEVYLPRYDDSEGSFIMASHADRLKQSQCFIQMKTAAANESDLRPYKNALTCVTCHNPHISVKQTNKANYIKACQNCHTGPEKTSCSEDLIQRELKQNDCVSCHMPLSGSIDIPHVRVHDHYIRKNAQAGTSVVNPNRRFLQLECINNENPNELNRARAYLQQFEKFDSRNPVLLDSARSILEKLGGNNEDSLFAAAIQLNYLSKNFRAVIQISEKSGHSRNAFFRLIGRDYSNADAWTAYQIGEAYSEITKHKQAFLYYGIAHRLAPFYFEFSNKYGNAALLNGQEKLAFDIFSWLTKENPNYAPAWSNLGYLMLIRGELDKSVEFSSKAIALNPDYVQARFNRAAVFSAQQNLVKLKAELTIILEVDPQNERARRALSQF